MWYTPFYYKRWDLHKEQVVGYFKESSPLRWAEADFPAPFSFFLFYFLFFRVFSVLSRSRDGSDARSADILRWRAATLATISGMIGPLFF